MKPPIIHTPGRDVEQNSLKIVLNTIQSSKSQTRYGTRSRTRNEKEQSVVENNRTSLLQDKRKMANQSMEKNPRKSFKTPPTESRKRKVKEPNLQRSVNIGTKESSEIPLHSSNRNRKKNMVKDSAIQDVFDTDCVEGGRCSSQIITDTPNIDQTVEESNIYKSESHVKQAGAIYSKSSMNQPIDVIIENADEVAGQAEGADCIERNKVHEQGHFLDMNLVQNLESSLGNVEIKVLNSSAVSSAVSESSSMASQAASQAKLNFLVEEINKIVNESQGQFLKDSIVANLNHGDSNVIKVVEHGLCHEVIESENKNSQNVKSVVEDDRDATEDQIEQIKSDNGVTGNDKKESSQTETRILNISSELSTRSNQSVSVSSLGCQFPDDAVEDASVCDIVKASKGTANVDHSQYSTDIDALRDKGLEQLLQGHVDTLEVREVEALVDKEGTDGVNVTGSQDKVNESINVQISRNEKGMTEYKCKLCNVVFAFGIELNRHVSEFHRNSSAFFSCHLCKKTFSEQRYLRTHLRRHAGEDGKKHECLICGWKFFEPNKLRLHMQKHKEPGERNLPYSCYACNRQFYTYSSLLDHMNIHTGNRPHKCQICGASFKQQVGLLRHRVVHEKVGRYECQFCKKTFKFKNKLTEHIVIHTRESKHKCQKCKRVYGAASSLRRHAVSCQAVDVSDIDQGGSNTEVRDIQVVQCSSEVDEVVLYICIECGVAMRSMEEHKTHVCLKDGSAFGMAEKVSIIDGNIVKIQDLIPSSNEAGSTLEVMEVQMQEET